MKTGKSHRHYTLREDTSDEEDPRTRSVARCRRVSINNSYRHRTLREETLDDDDWDIRSVRCRMVTLKVLHRNKTNLS